MRRGRFHLGVFLGGFLLVGALHVFVILPYFLSSLLKRSDAPMEVEYLGETVDEPAQAEPTAEEKRDAPKPAEQAKLDEKRRAEEKKKKPKPEQKKPEAPAPEVAKVEPPKPKPEEKKPEPTPPLQPPPPPPPKQRMKMVDQQLPDDNQDNSDARYLAQTNHRVAEDRRTLETNLIRNQTAPPNAPRPTEQSDNQLPNVGDRDRKIAELKDQRGKKNELVRGAPQAGDEAKAREAAKHQEPNKLAMRDLVPRNPVEKVDAVKPRDGVEMHEPGASDHSLPEARAGRDAVRAEAGQRGSKSAPRLDLSPSQFDKIVGFDAAEKERREAALGERSHTPGHWDKVQRQLAALRSSLENFTPEVKVGNQAELGTRAHPFAAYIAEMHRQIHKLWAFGFLTELDGKPPSSPFNDMSLWTQLEIVMQGDGSVEKITIVRPSGNAAFDAAAIDTVMASSPYAKPPPTIRSANGKVYLDWRFHRDDRQCGTTGVDPHILTTVGPNQDHDTTEVAHGAAETPPRTLRRGPSGGSGSPASPSLPLVPSVQAAGVEESPAPAAPPVAPTGEAATVVPDAAKDAAEGWFAAYARGDVKWLAGWSAAPFTAGGNVVAENGDRLKHVYKELLDEEGAARSVGKVEVLTAAGVRAKVGGLPPGGEGDGSMVFAVGHVGDEEFVLLLKRSDKGWRVCGMDR